MECNVSLRNHTDASSALVNNGNPANLVFLHQFFAIFYRGIWLAAHRNRSHQLRDPDGIGILPIRHDTTAEIAIGYDSLKQRIG
jgi:hypothetical protein